MSKISLPVKDPFANIKFHHEDDKLSFDSPKGLIEL
jgi:hypothetical protein